MSNFKWPENIVVRNSILMPQKADNRSIKPSLERIQRLLGKKETRTKNTLLSYIKHRTAKLAQKSTNRFPSCRRAGSKIF